MSQEVPQRSSNAETRGLIGLLARRMSPGGPLPRRVLLEVALLGGAALLVTSALIHLILWSGSYRAIPVIGPLFLLQGIAGALLAVGVVRFGHLGTVVAGAGYMAITTAGLLTSSKVGLFGFQENLSTLYRDLSINVQVTGFGLLIMAAYLIVSSGRSSRAETGAVPDDIPEPVRGLLVREQLVLAKLERSLGPDDPSTITSRINMAYYYLSAGSLPAATDLQERIVADSDRILGSNHPQTLTSRIKLAEWQKMTRKAG